MSVHSFASKSTTKKTGRTRVETSDESETSSAASPTPTTSLELTTETVPVDEVEQEQEQELDQGVDHEQVSPERASELEALLMERPPPDFSKPVKAEQVVAHAGAAATAMKNNDDVARNVLETAFKSSWNHAKHALVGEATTEPVMQELLELRQRTYDRVFGLTMQEIESISGTETSLTEGSAAGSSSLESDIDANFKGLDTEESVAIFNRIFTETEGWAYESGVVFDINAYAIDFMNGTQDDITGAKRALAEGARAGSETGGVTSSESDADVVQADIQDQDAWALVKVRQYTTQAEWEAHKKNAGVPKDTAALAESRHLKHYTSLAAKMHGLSGTPDLGGAAGLLDAPSADQTPQASLESLAAAMMTGQADPDVKAENLQLEAANRLYEDQLAEVKKQRLELVTLLADHDDAVKGSDPKVLEEAERAVEIHLTLLRDNVSQGLMLANEAYVTDGAVNHGVQGLQIGREIQQTNGESLNAVTENMADAMKEIRRHGDSLGEAAYKSGKYLWRMADAARNAGANGAEIAAIYKAGHQIANVIKKAKYPSDHESRADGKNPWHVESEKVIHKLLGDTVKDAEGLAVAVQTAGAKASKAMRVDSDSGESRDMLALGAPVKKDLH